MDPMSEEVLDSIGTGVKLPVRKDRPVKEIAAGKLYLNAEGQLGIPGDNLFACLREGGVFIPFRDKRKVSSGKLTFLPALVTLEQEFFPINHGSGWVVDKRKGDNLDGTACRIVRPKFNQWEIEVVIRIEEDLLSEKSAKQLFVEAGRCFGLCSFRTKGNFGRFRIKTWEVLERTKSPKAAAESTDESGVETGEGEDGEGGPEVTTEKPAKGRRAKAAVAS
ncbi:hypothetical protein HYW67_03330 [Candidatus Parcubacteria bacterium]|nr:hypothetical protein [Candidatus Parcubacteria bacterium]